VEANRGMGVSIICENDFLEAPLNEPRSVEASMGSVKARQPLVGAQAASAI